MLEWLKNVFSWLESLFGKAGSVVHTVLNDVAGITNVATPIVTELAAIASVSPSPTWLISEIEKWLGTYLKDAPAIAQWVANAQTLSTADILRTAATTALSVLVPSGTAASLINLAVELAYNVFKAAKKAPAMVPAAIPATVPAPIPAAAPVVGSEAAAPAATPVKAIQTAYNPDTNQYENQEIDI
jgi:hypothetical protein